MSRTSTGQAAQRARQRLKRRRAARARHHEGGYRREMRPAELGGWMAYAAKLRRLVGEKLRKAKEEDA